MILKDQEFFSPDYSFVARKIRVLRLQHGLSQKEVSEIIGINQ